MTRLPLRLFVFFTLLLAAPSSVRMQPPPDLSQLIDQLQLKYNRLSSLSADFVQLYTAPGERTRREAGRLLLKKPGRMRWEYQHPEPKFFLCDGKYVYEYVLEDGFISRMPLKESDDWRAPFAFLLGRGNLRQDFQQIESGVEAPSQAGNQVLRLIPKRSLEFRTLLLEVDPKTLHLARLSFVDATGARSDFLFSGLRENVAANETAFSPPPGIEIRKF
jgi:outer membrane lipoprotein carrier protein